MEREDVPESTGPHHMLALLRELLDRALAEDPSRDTVEVNTAFLQRLLLEARPLFHAGNQIVKTKEFREVFAGVAEAVAAGESPQGHMEWNEIVGHDGQPLKPGEMFVAIFARTGHGAYVSGKAQ